MRTLYQILSAITTIRSAFRGPSALGGNLLRKQAHKSLARTMRKF